MIEFVGQNGIFSNPVVEYNLAHGLYQPHELNVLRRRAAERIYRTDKRIIRILTPGNPEGLSRHYVWGPDLDSYVQRVRAADARIILQHPKLKTQFLDVTDLDPIGPAGTAGHGILLPVSRANPLGLFVPTELRQAVDETTAATREGR